jgi:hypothetical protein
MQNHSVYVHNEASSYSLHVTLQHNTADAILGWEDEAHPGLSSKLLALLEVKRLRAYPFVSVQALIPWNEQKMSVQGAVVVVAKKARAHNPFMRGTLTSLLRVCAQEYGCFSSDVLGARIFSVSPVALRAQSSYSRFSWRCKPHEVRFISACTI